LSRIKNKLIYYHQKEAGNPLYVKPIKS